MSPTYLLWMSTLVAPVLCLIAIDEALRTNRFTTKSLFLLMTLTAVLLGLTIWAMSD